MRPSLETKETLHLRGQKVRLFELCLEILLITPYTKRSMKVNVSIMKRYTLILIIVAVYFSLPKIQLFAQTDQIFIPNVTPTFIIRTPYQTASSGAIIGKGAKTTTTTTSPVFNLAVIGPALGGILTVALGSAFTLIKSNRKKKIFNAYMKHITDVEATYKIQVEQKEKNAKKTLMEALQQIQQEAELAAADKKIDEDQRTAVSHRIQRKLDEVGEKTLAKS